MDYRVLGLGVGTLVYTLGYLGLIWYFLRGGLEGLMGPVTLLLATGILLSMYSGFFFMLWLTNYLSED